MVKKFWCKSIGEKSPIEYILENDLEYPKKLRKLHVYLLAPKNLGTPSDMFSDYCKTILEIKIGDVKKNPKFG